MPAPDVIQELIQRFTNNLSAYKSNEYNETQVRREFIDPFFIALGWDVENKLGYAEAYKDVIHEDKVKVGGATKAPDYSFRIGMTRKFFVEAKKPAVNLQTDPEPAFQLRRYAWSAKLPLSILTDFEEFAVYDGRIPPKKEEGAGIARIRFYKYTDYQEKWEEIAALFSKEAILKGAFDRFADDKKAKRGTTEVDTAFLSEIEGWRNTLAVNIAAKNPTLTTRLLNFVVQKTIDRIIFLRICEDRGIETLGRLQSLLNGKNVYDRLVVQFREADDRYNSGLFHFTEEKGRDNAEYDPHSLTLKIEDAVLKKIIESLYYPSPYAFDVFPADILGQVYEQFLGKVIVLDKRHKATVEEKPEVRKAGGVYYTPTYIVQYIVQQTVGKLLTGKTPKQVESLTILDPACGSGSFLIGAYQTVLDWHLRWYEQDADGTDKYQKRKDSPIYPVAGGGYRLTTAERKRILLNNIYGVDIDPQAVEVTKLSLLLKMLEGETQETVRMQTRMTYDRVLPDLNGNIQCGNSLIGSDFYTSRLDLDEEGVYRVNAFDWNWAFPKILTGENPGFDAVIGNPPYVRQESLSEQKPYLQTHYETAQNTADLYVYFIEKGVNLLKTGGRFAYIVANKWFRTSYAEPLRKWLVRQQVTEIVDFGDLPVFQSATTYPCILQITKGNSAGEFAVAPIASLDFADLGAAVEAAKFPVQPATLDANGWMLTDVARQSLLKKLRGAGMTLEKYVNKQVYRGVLTGLNEAFVIYAATRQKLIDDDPRSAELIKPFLAGREVKRYATLAPLQFLIFARRGIDITQYPAVEKHLLGYKEQLMPKPTDYRGANWQGRKAGSYKWYELQDSIDYYQKFEEPKIIYPNILKRPEFTFDTNGQYTNQKCFIIAAPDKYLLGVLNSSVCAFLFEMILPKLRGGFYEPSYVYFKDFPIRTIDFADPADAARHTRMVTLVEQMLTLNTRIATADPTSRTMLARQIETTDRQIDALAYELYGLTAEEIAIVEGK